MSALKQISKPALRDLLLSNWMTHDAMWFASSARLCGVEKTNVVNRGAAKAMGEVEAQRLQQRTLFDLEMLKETGVCPGIENYSRHLDGRLAVGGHLVRKLQLHGLSKVYRRPHIPIPVTPPVRRSTVPLDTARAAH